MIEFKHVWVGELSNNKLQNQADKLKHTSNKASQLIKGDYHLSINNNKIILIDNANKITVETKCHPEDNFDIGIGIKEAFKKLNEKRYKLKTETEIKIGDLVEVINWKCCYPIDSAFFFENDLINAAKCFKYGSYLKDGDKVQLLFIKDNKCVVSRKEEIPPYGTKECVYLIDKSGLKKVDDTNG